MSFLKKKRKRKITGSIIVLHLPTKNLDDMIYSSWDIECDRLKLVIMGHFLPFFITPLTTQKIKFFKKNHFTHTYQKSWSNVRLKYWKNNQINDVCFLRYTLLKTGDIILLQVCTINEDHMMHGSWDIRHNSFLSIWTIFCPLTLKTEDIMILHCVKQMTIIYVWFLIYGAQQT